MRRHRNRWRDLVVRLSPADDGFPDYSDELLHDRAALVTRQNIAFSSWSPTDASGACPTDLVDRYAWRVPDNIMDLVPRAIREVLGVLELPLVVLRNLDLVELFAGRARITRWATCAKLIAMPIDRTHCPHMDILLPDGLAIAVVSVLRTKPGGLVFAGPQCSSWIWMTRKVTKRTKHIILGDTSVACVQEGNEVNRCVVLLCYLAWRLGVYWVVEQPQATLFFETQMMQHLISESAAKTVSINLGDYGHETVKPTRLVGTAPMLDELKAATPARLRPTTGKRKRLFVAVRREDGKVRIHGRKEAMRASQAYPIKFARVVCERHYPSSFVV